jgi:hypothetical protein
MKNLSRHPGPNEMTAKRWRFQIAQRLGIAHNSVYRLIARCELQRPKMRVVNQRVKFVIVNET